MSRYTSITSSPGRYFRTWSWTNQTFRCFVPSAISARPLGIQPTGDSRHDSTVLPRRQSFSGRPRRNNANPWSRKPEGRKKPSGVERRHAWNCGADCYDGCPTTCPPRRSGSRTVGVTPDLGFFLPSGQSGTRKVLLRESGVSTGLRAQVVCIESSRKRRGVVAGQPDRAGRQNAVSNCGADQGMLAYSHPCRPLSNATSQGRRFLPLSLTPYAPVLKAYRQRELQAGYQEQYQGLVASQAVVPALGGKCQGNGGTPCN